MTELNVTANNPASWIKALWEAVWAYEDTNPGDQAVDDVKLALHWLAEAADIDAVPGWESDGKNIKPKH